MTTRTTDPPLLLVCQGASCSERGSDQLIDRLRGARRPVCLTGCQGRCATGPNACVAEAERQLTAGDLLPPGHGG